MKEPYWINFDIHTSATRVDRLELDLSKVERLQTTREGDWHDGHRFAGKSKIIKLLFRYEGEVMGIDAERPGSNPEAPNEFHKMWIDYLDTYEGGFKDCGAFMEPQSQLIQPAGIEFSVSPIVKP